MASYIPTRDVELVPWADNFRDLIVANPATYGLLTADGVQIAAVVDPWDLAYAVAVNPSTRTPSTIAAKDSAKGAMLPELRFYSQQVKANMGVSNELKMALGIHINDAGPTPIPVPTTQPALTIDYQIQGAAVLRVRDQSTPTSNAKPFGVLGGEVAVTIGTDAATDPNAAAFRRIQTKTPFTIDFTPAENGKVATIWERWFNRKGELGPWSTPISLIVA